MRCLWTGCYKTVSGRFGQWFDEETGTEWERRLIVRALDELAGCGASLRGEYEALCESQAPPGDLRWWDLYVRPVSSDAPGGCKPSRPKRLASC